MTGKSGIYRFMPALRTEGSSREIFIAFKEQPPGSLEQLGMNSKKITLTNASKAFDIEYKKQRENSDLFAQISWKDDRIHPIIMENSYTFIAYP